MTDEARKKVIMVYVLLILTFFCSTVRAEEKCEAGAGDAKFTLYQGPYVMLLKGNVCVFDKSTAEWNGKDAEGNNVYFSGTYILRGGHHKNGVLKSKIK